MNHLVYKRIKMCLFFYFLLIRDGEKCALWEKILTKPNRYHAKDCSVIMGLCDSPFPGNASHRLKWLHVFQGKTQLALSRSLKIEKASNIIRVCTRILEIKYICNRISILWLSANIQEIIIFRDRLFCKLLCILRRRKKKRLYFSEKVFIHILCVYRRKNSIYCWKYFSWCQEVSLSLFEKFEKHKRAVLRRVGLIVSVSGVS